LRRLLAPHCCYPSTAVEEQPIESLSDRDLML
jgi:hypothetical protein